MSEAEEEEEEGGFPSNTCVFNGCNFCKTIKKKEPRLIYETGRKVHILIKKILFFSHLRVLRFLPAGVSVVGVGLSVGAGSGQDSGLAWCCTSVFDFFRGLALSCNCSQPVRRDMDKKKTMKSF